MALSNYVEIFDYAKKHSIAVGAFNSFNMESLQAVVGAADEKNSPLIVQTYHAHMKFAGADYMQAIANVASNHARVKIAMGLDHGQSFDQASLCINAGYSGVMIDLSSEDYDFNVAETKKVVALAHAKGISVEAELGKIMDAACTVEEIARGFTDPEMARKFAADTKIDCLAVSIGTAHGLYKYTPKINFDLLETLVKTIPCPVVVHGGSGTPDEDILKMVKLGIAKLNIGTDFFTVYNKTLLEALSSKPTIESAELMALAREAIKKVALHKLDMLTAYRT
jgi:ketose-bisphosphate aldolase